LPLNRLAESKLQEAGVELDPQRLYILQFLEWALQREQVAVEGPAALLLPQFLADLAQLSPQEAMRRLSGEQLDQLEVLESYRHKSPLLVGANLLSELAAVENLL